ncbi:MAG: class I SAM-dependent methyltransferase [Corynebacterium sp.]|uniref:class I SAM-dependent methyltransferase n=1 Tax=Corynebacterium sp. TaxID=1720 RepID=UPI0026DD3241|nr:class I SAM-dependent methyltransferase [Corynebacterium sp.]MDO4762633.1 class I SAM-dependent methyltransferase [Corynebacterium sp.]
MPKIGSGVMDKRARDIDHLQGHWLLAKLGKKVLRPGGVALSQWMLNQLNLKNKDVVELAPGLGVTAKSILLHGPRTYTGIDEDENAVAQLRQQLGGARIVCGSAAATGLDDAVCDVVVGEAMLSMQSETIKNSIVSEAARILRPGGHYGIHELALVPNDVDDKVAEELKKNLARSIKVNARPLTEMEWAALLEQHGFVLESIKVAPMGLLHPRQLIADEKLRVFKIVFNLIRWPHARKRVVNMRRVFRDNSKNLSAIGIVARKL